MLIPGGRLLHSVPVDVVKHVGQTRRGELAALMRSFALPSVFAGELGGLAFAAVMIISMGLTGMGFLTPVNLGAPALVVSVAPSPAALPSLISALGYTLPASVATKVIPVLKGGHYLGSASANQLGSLLAFIHVPERRIHLMILILTGHANNTTLVEFMSSTPQAARSAVMRAMPLVVTHVAEGAILHLILSAILGVLFFAVIGTAAWLGLPMFRTAAGIVSASLVGGVVVYAVNRWILLPPTNPMIALVPQNWFLLAHLVFGLVVGLVLAKALKSRMDCTRRL